MKNNALSPEIISNIVEIIGKFKDLKRRGWKKRNVNCSESDADHTFSMMLMIFLLRPKQLNLEKCFKLALIHDLSEIYSGDYLPDEISPEDKIQIENKSIQKLAKELNDNSLVELFNEYENKQSPEALFVNAIDKMDNVLTAKYYDNNNRCPVKLTPEFSQNALRKINTMQSHNLDIIREIIEVIQRQA